MTDQTTDAPEDEPTGASAPDGAPDEPETFDREYVQKLRDEAAGHRVKAKRADALNARLATAQAALTGKLADPPTCRSPTTCSTTTGSSTRPRCTPPSTSWSSASRTWPHAGPRATSGRVPGPRHPRSGSPRCCGAGPDPLAR